MDQTVGGAAGPLDEAWLAAVRARKVGAIAKGLQITFVGEDAYMTRASILLHMIEAEGYELRRKESMSTNDVPGAKPENHDKLAMGCWAEPADAKDKSLLLVEGNENGQVIFSMFDLDRDLEYRSGMREKDFKDFFTWKPTGIIKWTWHDKTPFPWSKVMKEGARDGVRHSTATALINAADKVRDALGLRAKKLDRDKLKDRQPREVGDGEEVAVGIMKRLKKGIEAFLGDDG